MSNWMISPQGFGLKLFFNETTTQDLELTTLPETNIAPKNDGFQVRNLQTCRGFFSGAMLVSGSVKSIPQRLHMFLGGIFAFRRFPQLWHAKGHPSVVGKVTRQSQQEADSAKVPNFF